MDLIVTLCRLMGRMALLLLLPVLAAAACYLAMDHLLLKPLSPGSKESVLVEIKRGDDFKSICRTLEEKKIVRHWWSLNVISRFRGEDTKIAAGEYKLSPSMTPREILRKLVTGDSYKRKLVFKEGQSIWELGKLVESVGLMSANEFNKALTDKVLLRESGIGQISFEGYLFPDTYHFTRPVDAKTIIWTMLERGEKAWEPKFSKRAEELNMTRHEILTLASIIEKESGNTEEQPLISAVFHNRLNKVMRLESDPTVVYGIPDFKGIITKEHLRTKTPYNTYINYGLPPGPICNPGKDAIRAALYPTPDTPYLFFVADGRGGHVFSATLKEHNQAVAEYRALMKLRGKR